MSSTPVTPAAPMDETAAGVTYALLAYVSWGLMPIYWKLTAFVPPLQMVAHRVVWSVVVLAAMLAVFKRFGAVRLSLTNLSHLKVLVASAALITVNWLVFIWAVQNGRVLETSLGYYINPLINVLLGMVLLGERLRRLQYIAVGIAAAGVLYATLQVGVVPWVALILAFTFGFYGLLRKTAPVDGMVGLTVETVLLLPIALGYLVWVQLRGESVFVADGAGRAFLIMQAGWVTALPLMWFANAARRLKYSTIGLFQYLAPSCALILAVTVFGEAFTTTHAVVFACIWIALALYTWDMRRALKPRGG